MRTRIDNDLAIEGVRFVITVEVGGSDCIFIFYSWWLWLNIYILASISGGTRDDLCSTTRHHHRSCRRCLLFNVTTRSQNIAPPFRFSGNSGTTFVYINSGIENKLFWRPPLHQIANEMTHSRNCLSCVKSCAMTDTDRIGNPLNLVCVLWNRLKSCRASLSDSQFN